MVRQLPVNFEFRGNQSFQDFYPGENLEIVEQLQQTASGQGETFIFIWGPHGYGKSHLLQACCQHSAEQGLPTIYLDLALPELHPSSLEGLESYSLVCLDNIESVTGDPIWEQELFHFFNRHRDMHHHLVISALISPSSLSISLQDLRTRLNWGLVLKLTPLSDDNKIAALTHKAKQRGLEVSPQTARFLLSHYERALPSLWPVLDLLDQASLAAQKKLTVPFIKSVLGSPTLKS